MKWSWIIKGNTRHLPGRRLRKKYSEAKKNKAISTTGRGGP
jgi:hypothetical protein